MLGSCARFFSQTMTLTAQRLQLHYAIQCAAAASASLLPPQPDSSHAALGWIADLGCVATQPLPGPEPIRVALEPVALAARLLDPQRQVVAELALSGETLRSALDWHGRELAKFGIDREIALVNYPDDFPDHPLARDATFDASGAEQRQTLAEYFALSDRLLDAIAARAPDASPVRLWPNHFDLATLITLAGTGEDATTVGVGFSPGDGGYDEPYWYVTPWPYPDKAQLPELPAGDWHTEGWVGAILTASQLDGSNEGDRVGDFLDAAARACRELLV